MLSIELLHAVNDIAIAAGAEILDVYNGEESIEITTKQDDSPLTDADRRANHLIVERLGQLTPEIPLLSEESDAIPFTTRKSWQRYWLIDPLDGTKEFISRNGEFTVNIALIEHGRAVAGVVYVPVSGICYFGGIGIGAYKREADTANTDARVIKCSVVQPGERIRIVSSRRHSSEQLDKMIANIEGQFGEAAIVNMGSSLKMCLLAEGRADIYPRLAPTSEWDTAAAHALLCAAGGELVDLHFDALRYNTKDELLNPYFIGLADPHYDWQQLLDKQ